jgi:hypothetical protein
MNQSRFPSTEAQQRQNLRTPIGNGGRAAAANTTGARDRTSREHRLHSQKAAPKQSQQTPNATRRAQLNTSSTQHPRHLHIQQHTHTSSTNITSQQHSRTAHNTDQETHTAQHTAHNTTAPQNSTQHRPGDPHSTTTHSTLHHGTPHPGHRAAKRHNSRSTTVVKATGRPSGEKTRAALPAQKKVRKLRQGPSGIRPMQYYETPRCP